MLADRESAQLAKRLISETCDKENIAPDGLTLHADRGAAMKSKLVAQLLADLSITKTHSRPHVSDDNPFSESQFKTMKYRPDFPQRFGSQQDALAFCRPFFDWYNNEHHHSALRFFTPAQVHHEHADEILARRQVTLNAAYSKHPERFPNGPPCVHRLPHEVWINPPQNVNKPKPPSAHGVVRKVTPSHHEPLISIHRN